MLDLSVRPRLSQTLVRAPALAFAAAAALLSGAPATATDASVENGRKVAQTHCARCHVIGDFNKYGGIGSTPSFQLLVKRRPDYRARFETFFERPPHPAFVTIDGFQRRMPELPVNAAPVTLPLSAVNDILAFVETLKPRQ